MCRVYLFVFAAAGFVAATSAHGLEASCDLSKCMSICRSDYESGCAGMCGRIISLCKQLVLKPKRMRGAWQPDGTLHEPVELGARARKSLSRTD
jgi:hypothetical protein